MGGGKRTAPLQSPAPIWPHAVVRGTQMFFAGLQHQHQKSLAGQQHGQRSPAKPGNPRKTWLALTPLQIRAAPKTTPSQFRAEAFIPHQGLHGQRTGSLHGISHSWSWSSAVKWRGDGKHPEGQRLLPASASTFLLQGRKARINP